MKIANVVLFLIVCTFVCSFTTSAIGQEGEGTAKEGEGFLDAPWKFNVNVYGWLPSAPATIKVKDETIADVPEDLSTILDSMDFAAMFELEVHKGRVFLFSNTIYYKGDWDTDFTGKISGARRTYGIEEKVWAIKYGAGYQLGPWDLGKSAEGSPSLVLYPWVGGFFFHDDWEVSITPGGMFDGVNKEGTLEFNTPMVGLAARFHFLERWYLLLSYGEGGWDVDNAKRVYDFIGDVGYQFTMWDLSSKVFAGYRYLHIEYEKQPVEIKVDVKGPFFGIGWEF